jgi:hypothetical protein
MPYRTFIDKKKEPQKKLKKPKKKKDKLKQKQKQQQKQSVVLNVSAGSSGGGGGFIPQQAPQIDYSLIANLLRPSNTIQQPFRETIAEPEPILPRRAEVPTLEKAVKEPKPKKEKEIKVEQLKEQLKEQVKELVESKEPKKRGPKSKQANIEELQAMESEDPWVLRENEPYKFFGEWYVGTGENKRKVSPPSAFRE